MTATCLVFGFNQSTFRAIEQSESYTINIGFWSGTIPDFVIGRVELTLEGTTSEFTLFRFITPYNNYYYNWNGIYNGERNAWK